MDEQNLDGGGLYDLSDDAETETRDRNNPDAPLITSTPTFKPDRKPQIFATLIVAIGAFALGNVLGWSSPALPKLEKGGELGELTVQMKSWIGSIVNLGGAFSGFIVGYGIDRVGRKMTLLIISVPFVFGWLLIALSQNFSMMLVGRFVTGFCGAAFTLVSPIYISEISDDNIRGTLSSAVILSLVIGILFTYVLGAIITWIWLSIVCATIPVIFVFCMVFMPESPTYLIMKGNHAEASHVLEWLRGASRVSQIEPELVMIQERVDELSTHSTSWKNIMKCPILKPIGISLMLFILQQFGGVNAVVFYSVEIFGAAGTDINENVSGIIVGVTQVVMCAVSTFIVDRAGRKILLIISDAGMAASLFALAIFFYMKEQNENKTPENLGWLPLTSLVFYMITYNIALATIPWVMMGEILPPHVKSFASSLASTFCWTLGFIVTKNFGLFVLWFGESTVFFTFGVISAIGSIFALLIIPETKGKSLEEIQALFRS